MLDFNGVYVLVDSLKFGKPEIYIGKGNVKKRVLSHDKKKDFWNVIFAVKLDDGDGFNNAYNSYLEYHFIKTAKNKQLAVMKENKQVPKRPTLSEPEISDLNCYINTIEILFSTLGLKCFQLGETQANSVFTCKDKYGNIGKGEYLEEIGFMLYKDAICSLTLHKGTTSLPIREDLIRNGILHERNGHYILKEDKIFSSVSAASSVVLGRRSNGWTEWKDANAKTLDKLKR